MDPSSNQIIHFCEGENESSSEAEEQEHEQCTSIKCNSRNQELQQIVIPNKRGKTLRTEINGSRIVRSSGRKDRHSKVSTARGTRDRRVRLSPNTAIQFYDVQDRLGYDRPSKAIDWLMKEAKAEIDALINAATAIDRADDNDEDNQHQTELKEQQSSSDHQQHQQLQQQDQELNPNFSFSNPNDVLQPMFFESFSNLESDYFAYVNSQNNQMITQREPLQSSSILQQFSNNNNVQSLSFGNMGFGSNNNNNNEFPRIHGEIEEQQQNPTFLLNFRH